jgi:homoserine kinase
MSGPGTSAAGTSVAGTSGDWVRAFAPASVSNVACGFDVLGFALDGLWLGNEAAGPPGDMVEARFSEEPGVHIEAISGAPGVEILPVEAARNTAGRAALAMLDRFESLSPDATRGLGIALRITKCMPLRSGLGSSAASAVAAAVAVNELLGARLGTPLTRRHVLACALEGERIASGSLHADNVAPALFGGFVLVRALTPDVDVVRLVPPSELYCAIVRPHLEVDTQEARRALPERVPLRDAVRQWANVGALVAALHSLDFELLGRALEDRIAEPYRTGAVPGFATAMAAARVAGALGGSLSGSGPSLFALVRGEAAATRVAEAMADGLALRGVQSDRLVSRLRARGARVLRDGSEVHAKAPAGTPES